MFCAKYVAKSLEPLQGNLSLLSPFNYETSAAGVCCKVLTWFILVYIHDHKSQRYHEYSIVARHQLKVEK